MSKQRFWYGVLIVILGTWSALELGLVYRLALNLGWVRPVVSARSDGDPEGRLRDLYTVPGPDPVVLETQHWAVDGVYVAQGAPVGEDEDDTERVTIWQSRERVGWPFRTAVITSYWSEVSPIDSAPQPLPAEGEAAPEPHVRVKPSPILPGILLASALHTALIGLGVMAARWIARKRHRTEPVTGVAG